MSGNSSFRTDLVKILREFVLPWSRHNELSTLVASVPLLPQGRIKLRPTPEPVIKVKRGRKITNNLTEWPSLGVHSKPNPCLGCVLDGSVDLPIGVTDAMVKATDASSVSGIYQARLQDKCILIFPSNVPICDGKKPHWDDNRQPQPDSSILWIDFLAEGAILHTCHSVKGRHVLGECQLVLNTRSLPVMDEIIEESQLHSTASRNNDLSRDIIHSLLNVLFLNLYRSLLEQKSQIDLHGGEILLNLMAERGIVGEAEAATLHAGIVSRCCSFIQGHLSRPITVEAIANFAFVSPAQLNRLFRAELNQSVKEYVNNQRLLQAQKLLVNTSLPINFISDSIGIAEPAYFSRVFRQKFGVTPGEYRRLHQ